MLTEPDDQRDTLAHAPWLTWGRKSPEPARRQLSSARQALPSINDKDGRATARQVLQVAPATPDASEAVDERDRRTPGAAQSPAQACLGPVRLDGDRLPETLVSMLGPGPYRLGDVLAALRAGRSVRDVDKALSLVMSRSEARNLINKAKAALLGARQPRKRT